MYFTKGFLFCSTVYLMQGDLENILFDQPYQIYTIVDGQKYVLAETFIILRILCRLYVMHILIYKEL